MGKVRLGVVIDLAMFCAAPVLVADVAKAEPKQFLPEKGLVEDHPMIVHAIALATDDEADKTGEAVGEAMFIVEFGTGSEVGHGQAQDATGFE